ncbi:unnamed protein product [Effrenium voratum]|uniref:USP domain-containing protein n=1 Tax=Effrenium voratum TaxID=2562239 RepID=A0AA36HN99_9DINO|nr:unnamed protein product [Effrenium voratum]
MTAAVSAYAPYGQQFGQFAQPYGQPASPGFAGGVSVGQRLRRMLLELKPLEQKQMEAQSLVQQCPAQQVGDCMRAILEQPVQLPWMHTLGVQILTELLRLFPQIVAGQFQKAYIPQLFPDSADVDLAAAFLHSLLRTKEAMGQSCQEEGGKFQRLLLKKTQLADLRKVPACSARAWMVQIWRDVTSARPRAELLVECCARYLADPNDSPMAKIPCLEILKQEFSMRGPAEAEPWLLSTLFEQVCRDPANHSADLQQLLWFLDRPPSVHAVRALLAGLAQEKGRLATLWACLCLWAPQPPPDALRSNWPAESPPIHVLLRAMLVAYSQLPDSKLLCRTCLLSVAAIATGQGQIAQAQPALLLMLHKEGPVLPADVWMPLAPLLDHLASPQAAELAHRLRAAAGFASAPPRVGQPPMYAAAPQEFHSHQPPHQMAFAHQMPQMPQMPQAPQLPQASQLPPAPSSTAFLPLPAESSLVVVNDHPKVGLQNTNNTCYMNSFIQALFLTDAFIWRIFSFQLQLKPNASKIDKEDFEFGKKVVDLLQHQFAKMALTKHKHTDIWDILQAFPDAYRSGEQQDVTETIRFVFDKLGGSDQPLIREVFAGNLQEKLQCKVCGTVKEREETFMDLVLSVPTEQQVTASGVVPTTQMLLNERLKFEELDDDCLVTCERCQEKRKMGKWCEIVSPPAHLCICLNRFTFNMEKMDFTKEKTPIKVDEGLRIGAYEYELYHVILHTGKDASSGHYYAIGRRSEPVPSGDNNWYTMDDSQLKPADLGLLAGRPSEKLKDDNPYVLFFRCKQAPRTPEFRVPKSMKDFVKKEDKKQD